MLVGGSIYLRTESVIADRFARAGALVGVVFTTVTLVMGMLWAKPIWGSFWTWDARLTSTLVLWIIYAGYLLVRRLSDPGRQAARLAAVVGIFGFIDVPVVHFSVTWWRTQHPGPIIVNDALPSQMLTTFFLTMACTLVLAAEQQPELAQTRPHSPATSGSAGLRFRKTWSGSPFSAISR